MNWKNALKDEPPQSGLEVLIAVKGVYYYATYGEDSEGFQVSGQDLFIPLKEVTIYWAEIEKKADS